MECWKCARLKDEDISSIPELRKMRDETDIKEAMLMKDISVKTK